MTERTERHFPDLISRLARFQGPFDAFRLPADGCDVLFATYPAGTVIEDHSHDTHNIGVITKGELTLTVRGVESRHGPGDWYDIPAGVTHAARFDTDSAEIEFWFASDRNEP
jgi:quercetin dioxygenase-like cupin family protein